MKKKRILIDALSYDPKDGGFAVVYRDLLSVISKIDALEVVLICHSKHDAFFSEFGVKVDSVIFPYKLRYFISFLITPFKILKWHPAVVHFETVGIPFFIWVKSTVTVHDLYFLKSGYKSNSSFGGKLLDLYWKFYFPKSVKKANRVRVISRFTKSDVKRFIGIENNVRLVYPMIEPPKDSNILPISNYPKGDEPLRLLFIGSIIPRKNLNFLIESLGYVKRKWKLDIVGNVWDSLPDSVNYHESNISIHGYVNQARLEELFAFTHFLISPSIEEGFGMPVVEAMVRNTPVLTSNIDVYKEFVDSSARFNIHDPVLLANLIDDINEDFYRRQLRLNSLITANFSRENYKKKISEFFTI